MTALLRKFRLFILVALAVGAVAIPAYAASSNGNGNGRGKQVTIGSVTRVGKNDLVVDSQPNNKTVTATTDLSTQVTGRGKNNLKLSDIKPDDLVAIISTDSGETDSKKALKVFVKSATESAQSKRQAVEGVISSISGNTITLVHQTQRDRTTIIITDSSTIIFGDTSGKNASGSGKLSALAVGERIIAIGEPSASGLLAKRIHIIPGKGLGIFKKQPLATPSGTTSTGSGTPATGSGTTSTSSGTL